MVSKTKTNNVIMVPSVPLDRSPASPPEQLASGRSGRARRRDGPDAGTERRGSSVGGSPRHHALSAPQLDKEVGDVGERDAESCRNQTGACRRRGSGRPRQGSAAAGCEEDMTPCPRLPGAPVLARPCSRTGPRHREDLGGAASEAVSQTPGWALRRHVVDERRRVRGSR